MNTAVPLRSKAVAKTVGSSVLAIGIAVLAGWMLDIATLKGVFASLMSFFRQHGIACGLFIAGGALSVRESFQ